MIKFKKSNVMNKKLSFIIFLVVFSITTSSSQFAKTNKVRIIPDSAVIQLWGDLTCNILFNPSKVNCYILNPTARPEGNSKIIGGFVVDRSIGNIANTYYPVLQFLLADVENYQTDSTSISKCPFTPYLAFEFTKNKEKVYLLVAYNCKSWGIVHKGIIRHVEYNCHQQLIRFSRGILPYDNYISVISKH